LIDDRFMPDHQIKTSEVLRAMPHRQPFDLLTYIHDIQTRPCFICEMVAGNPAYAHEIVYEDDVAIAFLNKYPPPVNDPLSWIRCRTLAGQ